DAGAAARGPRRRRAGRRAAGARAGAARRDRAGDGGGSEDEPLADARACRRARALVRGPRRGRLMGKLDGRVGLLTGTAAGIGAAGAALFAAEGAALVTFDVNEEAGRQTVAGIEAEGGRALFVHGDVSRDADVRRAVETAVEAYD